MNSSVPNGALIRHRGGESDERIVESIHLCSNGIAAGLRNSG
jgi:phosphoenolpyruvate carboxylase